MDADVNRTVCNATEMFNKLLSQIEREVKEKKHIVVYRGTASSDDGNTFTIERADHLKSPSVRTVVRLSSKCIELWHPELELEKNDDPIPVFPKYDEETEICYLALNYVKDYTVEGFVKWLIEPYKDNI